MTFSQKLKTAMENLNLRQVDVANLTGKGKNAISQYIAGKNKKRNGSGIRAK